jgi:hypothetical protein
MLTSTPLNAPLSKMRLWWQNHVDITTRGRGGTLKQGNISTAPFVCFCELALTAASSGIALRVLSE